MHLQDLIAWTIVLAGGLFLYFNLVALIAEWLGKKIVHKLNMRIKAKKAEEERIERICTAEYLQWLHSDPCWYGE